MQTEIVAVQ